MLNKKTITNHFQKYWPWWGIFLIMIVALFLRGYNFEEWLLFRADQARDAHYASEALEKGPGYLRLLGPRAGDAVRLEDDTSSQGDVLKLGPIYYYFQYISALIFGGASAWALVVPDFFFSFFSIPLFYFLLRQLFSRKISFCSVVVFASSFILFEYSRFAWNTNQLVFWEILLALSLIKIANRKTDNLKGFWLLSVASSLAILSQLHFIAFFGFSALVLIIIFIYRPGGIPKKFWFGAMALIILVYAPVIISDIKNKGDNAKRFLSVIKMEKETKNNENENDKTDSAPIKTLEKHGKYYPMILTSINRYEINNISMWGILFIIFSLAVVILFSTQYKKEWFKNLPRNHSLSAITLIWFFAFFFLFLKVLPRIDNVRYWLLIAPLVFIFLAFWLAIIDSAKGKILKNLIIFTIISTLSLLNITAILNFYHSFSKGQEDYFLFRKNIIASPFDLMFTFDSMKKSSFFMVEKSNQGTGDVCFYITEYQIKLGYDYIFDFYHPETIFESTDSGSKDLLCDFFIVAKTSSGEKKIKKYLKDFNVTESRQFQALTVWYLEPKIKSLDRKKIKPELDKKEKIDGRAIYWKDVF